MKIPLLLLATLLFLASCAVRPTPQVVTPSGPAYPFDWDPIDLEKGIAVRQVLQTEECSHFVIRVKTREKPHVHDHHDLIVFMLEGEGRLNYADRSIDVHAGDVMQIPRGTIHWAENTGTRPSVVYAVFTPPYDGTDSRRVDGGDKRGRAVGPGGEVGARPGVVVVARARKTGHH